MIRQLIVRIGREMDCSYAKVLGELKKLGIRKICKTTVRNIMQDAEERDLRFGHLIHDWDTKFTHQFDGIL